ncbi:MAG: hypothetical protein IIB56_01765 [Planctomycetes bacterium]|nr:hypothetical protein [Planctomycetota bacterium]
MRRVFRESGRRSLFDDGLVKVKRGLTTIEEVLRVTEACSITSDVVSDEDENHSQSKKCKKK